LLFACADVRACYLLNELKMNNKKTFSATKRRHLMACVLALVTATVMITGMTTYLPLQMSEQILLPILLFPIIWVGLFIYAYISEKAWQPLLLMITLCLVHGILSYFALMQGQG
tara:strand:- start:101 stop:442 length:342 start_codon:yes stop_codon:yes gene_type:complete